jgi:hypothetical protein
MWANFGIAELAPVVNLKGENAKLHAAIANAASTVPIKTETAAGELGSE